MTRCPEKCGKQWRPKQGKLGWQKQKKEEVKEERRKDRKTKEKKTEEGKDNRSKEDS